MIDEEGYRANVGIILINDDSRVFWARRIGQDAWQFPQGGIDRAESPEQAMYRELREETGLEPDHVDVLGCTSTWLKYKLPKRYVRRHQTPLCIGQKQIWFLLHMLGDEAAFDLGASPKPEFDHWRWVEYWKPSKEVIFFKRQVYQKALTELEPLLAQRA